VLALHQVLVLGEVRDRLLIFKLAEPMPEKRNLALVIVQQEICDILLLDDALQLRLLVGGEGDQVVIVLVHYLHRVKNLGVEVDVDQLRGLVVVVVLDSEVTLNFEPILDGYKIEYFNDEFEPPHLSTLRGTVSISFAPNLVFVVTNLLLLRILQVKSVVDVLLHELFADQAGVFPYQVCECLLVELLLLTECHFLVLITSYFKLIQNILKFLSDIQSHLKEVTEGYDPFVFSFFTIRVRCQ